MVELVHITAPGDSRFHGCIPKGYSIASGPGPRGVDHSCVALDGEIVHDPHPSREGLIELRYFEVLVAVLS